MYVSVCVHACLCVCMHVCVCVCVCVCVQFGEALVLSSSLIKVNANCKDTECAHACTCFLRAPLFMYTSMYETIVISSLHVLQVQIELDKAMPALQAAEEALNVLTKKDMSELKAYAKPPALVELTLNAVMTVFR